MHSNVVCTRKIFHFELTSLSVLLVLKLGLGRVSTPSFSLFSWENINVTELAKLILEKCHFDFLKKMYPLFGVFKENWCEILAFSSELFNI